MKNWKTIKDEIDLPTVEGLYVVYAEEDGVDNYEVRRFFKFLDSHAELKRAEQLMWLTEVHRYIPEPIPPYPGEETD